MGVSKIRDLFQEGKALEDRKDMFKDPKKICGLMVSGEDETEGHYQVLIMDKENSEIIFIEHSEEKSLEKLKTKELELLLPLLLGPNIGKI